MLEQVAVWLGVVKPWQAHSSSLPQELEETSHLAALAEVDLTAEQVPDLQYMPDAQ